MNAFPWPQWYSLSYVRGDGTPEKLYNLQLGGCAEIERAQRGLGSHTFERLPQLRHFSQYDLDNARRVIAGLPTDRPFGYFTAFLNSVPRLSLTQYKRVTCRFCISPKTKSRVFRPGRPKLSTA